MKKKNEEVAIEIADELNKKMKDAELFIPILDGFTIRKEQNDNLVFVAVNEDNVVEQFLTDGYLDKDETEEERIGKVIGELKLFSKNQDYTLEDDDVVYYRNYKTEKFSYHTFIQDMVNNDNTKFIRNLCAYFVEPTMNEFFQVCLSSGPFKINDKNMPVSKCENLEEDKILTNLTSMIEIILGNIDYIKDRENR